MAGTLLGSVITHLFQRLAAKRNEAFTRSETTRQERLAGYSGFAAAVEDYLHGQATRWYRRQEAPDGEAFRAARDEAHRLRTLARQSLYRVKLLTDDEQVLHAAEHAYRCTWDVSNAKDQPGHDTRDAEAKRAIDAFISQAGQSVR